MAMMDRLAHRGPDGQGLLRENAFVFGHRRLAVIDLVTGSQPMVSADNALTIVFNGEIYNFIELRQRLIQQGHVFRTNSDTEVILQLYARDGMACVNHLNGIYAFVIFDRRQGRLFAARDHFGTKPLYYWRSPDGRLAFASEIKAFLAHPDFRVEPNEEALQEYFTFQWLLGDKTLFGGVKQLEPGHCLSWDVLEPGSLPAVHRYWQPTFRVDESLNEEAFLDRLLLVIQDAVSIQLRSDVPVGIYLSGGLDSSTVCALAAKQFGGTLKCFTGRFAEGAAYDESAFARQVAAAAGAELYEVVPTAEQFATCLPSLIYQMDQPMAGPGMFPQYEVSKLAAANVKVVLGGQGGDELFGGYARYLVAYLEQCLKGAIYDTQEEGRFVVTLESVIHSLPAIREYVPMLREFWKDGLFDAMDQRYFRLIERSHAVGACLTDDFHASYDRGKIYASFAEIFNGGQVGSYLNKMLRFDQLTLLPALLHVEDRMSMAVSVESRVPLLDHRLADLANSIPPAFKFKNGRLKNLLREVMRNFLPRSIIERRDKMGFPVPLNQWVKEGPVRDFVMDTLLGDTARRRGVLRCDHFENHLAAGGEFSRELWGALSLELWYRQFVDSGKVVR